MGTKELEKKSSGGGLVAAWKQNPLVSTGLVLILMIVVQTAIMIYNFGEGSVGELLLSLLTNWLNILRNNAPVGIIALGMTFVIISGGIDLSVGSTLVAVGAMVMMVVDGSATGLLSGMGITGVPAYIIAIAVGLVFGALLGWLNGVLIAHGKLPPFIATLGTMQIFRSVTQHLTQHANPSVPKGFLQIANLKIGSFYIMPILYWLAIALHRAALCGGPARQGDLHPPGHPAGHRLCPPQPQGERHHQGHGYRGERLHGHPPPAGPPGPHRPAPPGRGV